MYKYIKGITVMSEERLYSTLEIAEEYFLWMPFDNSLVPHEELVSFIISTFIHEHNLKVSEYYYISKKGAFQVFSKQFYVPIMEEFIKYLESNNIAMNKDSVYQLNNFEFMYFNNDSKNQKQKCQIIDFQNFKQRRKGETKHDETD